MDSDDDVEYNEGTNHSNLLSSSTEDLSTDVEDSIEFIDSQYIQNENSEGLRPIDIRHFYSEIQKTYANHCITCEIQLEDWNIVKIYKIGLRTRILFRCQLCMYECSVWHQNESVDIININEAAVAGTIAIGIGFFQMEEFFLGINMSCMSGPTYNKYRENIIHQFQIAAEQSMRDAAENEKNAAIALGHVVDGHACVPVIADGAYEKRSYGHSYDSLSGCAAVVGERSKKVMYVDVRNKYCSYCEYYARINQPIKEHSCYKNFDRDAASGSMEADIIAEAFMNSMTMFGLIFYKLIADNDSRVYKAIMDLMPYREYNISVEKVDCTNHLLRNFSDKLRDLAKKTEQQYFRNRQFARLRKLIDTKVKTLRDAVYTVAAIRHYESGDIQEREDKLRQDILDIVYHVFGEHGKCESHEWVCPTDDENHIPALRSYGLLQQLEMIMRDLSSHSRSLVQLLTNNAAEGFNSVVCKLLGGKRCFSGARGSYNARVYAAVLQYNGSRCLAALFESMKKNVPPMLNAMYKRRRVIVEKNKVSRHLQERPSRARASGAEKHYGTRAQKLDKLPADMARARKLHEDSLRANANRRSDIEKETRAQGNSPAWHVYRKMMLTASNFGEICRRRSTTKVHNLVKKLMYYPIRENKVTKYGHVSEEKARKQLSDDLGEEIAECGLFISEEHPFLGASPDGLIGDDGLAEFKCPFKAQTLTPQQAMEEHSDIRSIFDAKDPNQMNRKHRFYYQVIGQLRVTGRQYCRFVLWTPLGYKEVIVQRDDEFWETQMRDKLINFYNKVMIPEIIDGRIPRSRQVREPGERGDHDNPSVSSETTAVESQSEPNTIPDVQTANQQTNAQANITPFQQLRLNDPWFDQFDNEVLEWGNQTTEERRQYLDEQSVSADAVAMTLLNEQSDVGEVCITTFLKLVRDTTRFQTQNVTYLFYRDIAQPVTGPSIQITNGGHRHWHCLYFDGDYLHVYDSIHNFRSFSTFSEQEQEYIQIRFRNINPSRIVFHNVQEQPGNINCGIFAMAFATTIALGGNPATTSYSRNMMVLREHCLSIIRNQTLEHFPH